MTDWRDRAACIGTDPDAFHPDQGGPTYAAKRVCNGGPGRPPCEVRDECLNYALSFPDELDYGVYGGLSAKERTAIRRGNRGVAA